MKKLFLVALLCAALCVPVSAQKSQLTKEAVLNMSIEELSDLPLEDLMYAVELLEVKSVDELFALIMNKNVSSASKEEEDAFRSPLSSTVITRSEMRTYGISTIEEAFRLIPGMIVSEKTNGIYDVQMRGLNSIPDNGWLIYAENQNVLVMVDGRISHSYVTGSPNFEELPISIEDVERIEVVRGATSALYGPNAVNGVINIITTKPDQSTTFASGSLQIGNKVTVGDFAFRKPVNNKFAFGVSANWQERFRRNNGVLLIPQDGSYIADPSVVPNGTTLTADQLAEYLADGTLVDVSNGGTITLDQMNDLMYVGASDENGYTLYDCLTADMTAQTIHGHADVARRNEGINGYVSITPSEKIRLDLTGGYQYALYNTTPVGSDGDESAFRERKSQTEYVNLEASIYGLHFLTSYSDGLQDFCVGTAGFQASHSYNFSARAEYDFYVGDLGIRPGVGYQYVKYRDKEQGYYDYGDGPVELSGFFGYYSQGNNSAKLTNFSPSVRLDYKNNNFRVIGAVRVDKTNIPDKWNPSWQLAANYLLNEKNFIRFVYGRSFRSAMLMNTSSNYSWRRGDGTDPEVIQFLGNKNADLMHIDNFELGYRVKFSDKVLLDAEAFYSMSEDYGMLKSYRSMLTISGTDLMSSLTGLLAGSLGSGDVSTLMEELISTKSYFRYDVMPFKVHQGGISMNLDWIISPKLIAKVNANFQQTRIDNYYQYKQNEMITNQLLASYKATVTDGNLENLATELITTIATVAMSGGSVTDYLSQVMLGHSSTDMRSAYNAMSESEQEAYLQSLLNAANGGAAVDGVEYPLGLYYALKYNVEYDSESDSYYFGSSVSEDYETRDNHKHKATPSVYGMVGLIYKPWSTLSVSAFANYMSKREYVTGYGTSKIDGGVTLNLKVGYKPMPGCEVFFNGHNLFDSNKQEFAYTDKIRGVYTVGVNFEF